VEGVRFGRSSGRAGVAKNERLTASLGAVMLVLLALEGLTILGIGPLLAWHVAIGMMVVSVFIAKTASTFHRFSRYYLGDPAYREKGPPPLVLRLAGPFVVGLTAVLLASGIALLYVPVAWRAPVLLVHKGSFVLWFGVMCLHVLGHFGETVRRAPRDWVPGRGRCLAGAGARRAAILVSVAVGAGLAAVVMPAANHYLNLVPH
jgi:hypothetical protein